MAGSISRKNFLKLGSALAVSSMWAPAIILPKKKEKLGVALVGLGNYSNGRLAPGLQMTEHCELRGIVTGTPSKIPDWQEQYGIPDQNVYDYENMHEIANNDDIDIIYSVTPPGKHARDSIAGAEAGKHVWCEKPMAMDLQECEAIIDAARKNRVHLSIGHRMHHEPNTQKLIRFGREEVYGAVREVSSGAGFRGSWPEDDWRVTAALGGGALYDMGVYPINAARHMTGKEPVAVTGKQRAERTDMFREVDEYTEFELEFPDGIIARGETSFGSSMNYLEVTCTGGWYRLQPFQSYSRVQGETSSGTELPPDPDHQQARQMDNEALAIKEGRSPVVPGRDGLEDIRIVRAIMKSAQNGGLRVEL